MGLVDRRATVKLEELIIASLAQRDHQDAPKSTLP